MSGRSWRDGTRGGSASDERDIVGRDRLAAPVADQERHLPPVVRAMERDVEEYVLQRRAELLARRVVILDFRGEVVLNISVYRGFSPRSRLGC